MIAPRSTLGQDALLQFQNAEDDKDCLVGFLGTPWHTHDNFMFAGRGPCTELDYLDLVVALKDGRILICEQRVDGQTVDRWLIHKEYNDEFRFLEEGEEIVVRSGDHARSNGNVGTRHRADRLAWYSGWQ